MAFEELQKKLEKNGFTVKVFSTGEEVSAYLNQEIDQNSRNGRLDDHHPAGPEGIAERT